MNQKLVEGPIFKSMFVQYKWLAFNDRNGNNCFDTYTHLQIINTIANHDSNRNIEYAKIFQNGTWD